MKTFEDFNADILFEGFFHGEDHLGTYLKIHWWRKVTFHLVEIRQLRLKGPFAIGLPPPAQLPLDLIQTRFHFLILDPIDPDPRSMILDLDD